MAHYLHLVVKDGQLALDHSYGPADRDPYTGALGSSQLADNTLAIIPDANPHSAAAIREMLNIEPVFLPATLED